LLSSFPARVPQDGGVRGTGGGVSRRAALLAVLLAAGLAVALLVELPSVAAVRAVVADAGAAGRLLLVLGTGLALLLPVPRTALSVLVGLVAGFAAGLPIALAGGLLGALGAFGLSRWLGRDAAVRLAGPRVARADRLLARHGFLVVLTGRVLPVVPFVVLSYGAGLTAVRLGPYMGATALGLIPSTALQVGAGASVAAVLPGAAVAAVVAVLLLVGTGAAWWARRRSASAEQPAQHAAGPADGAGGQLQDGPAGDAGDRLHDRREPQQAADVVHP
jgi:uncharacterized membrane protein YdjX (TVP38/TMEM64 family)